MINRTVFVLCMLVSFFLVWCAPHSEKEVDYALDISSVVYNEIVDADNITVNGEVITIENRLLSWKLLADSILDRPIDVFDKIETIQLSSLTGYTMIYSVPSLDTPVCTLQTKQIEAAAKQLPWVNFVIISHDTPFALDRFCVNNEIANVLTLSDARRKKFAKENGLYMKEYDLMTRAVIIIDDDLQVIYVDYADEVTSPVDLLNAFGKLNTL